MLDLDSFEKTIEVKYKGVVYKLEKIKEREREIYDRITEAIKNNDMSIFDDILEFVVERFKKADKSGTFKEDDFRDEATIDMLNVIFEGLAGTVKKK